MCPAPAPEVERLPFLSVCVPARDEARSIGTVLDALHRALRDAGIPHEILVECSGSIDDTRARALARNDIMPVRVLDEASELGFGRAVRAMFDLAMGDVLTVVMGDGCEDPADVVRVYTELLESGADAVFGSRFMRGAKVEGYPRGKRLLNRIGNAALACLFVCPHSDLTNGFKLYRREALSRLGPLRSDGFGITIEIALGLVVSGVKIVKCPISWRGSDGQSRFSLRGYWPAIVDSVKRRRRRAI